MVPVLLPALRSQEPAKSLCRSGLSSGLLVLRLNRDLTTRWMTLARAATQCAIHSCWPCCPACMRQANLHLPCRLYKRSLACPSLGAGTCCAAHGRSVPTPEGLCRVVTCTVAIRWHQVLHCHTVLLQAPRRRRWVRWWGRA